MMSLSRWVMIWGLVILALHAPIARAQQQVGPVPGNGYGATADPFGRPIMHIGQVDPGQGSINYVSVLVGTTSTLVLGAPATLARSKLYLVNPSGRLTGTTATDVWCAYGVAAVVGQGFMLAGYGDRVTEDITATIDQRALNCISSAPTTINAGAIQQ